MARHIHRRPDHHPEESYFLDSFNEIDIKRWAGNLEKFSKFHWDFFSNLAYQRSKIIEEIKNTLACTGEPFHFEKWQRTVKYKYSNHPLCVDGSMKDPGGRFNIGDINPDQFSPFPAIYVAEDRTTSFAEMFCQRVPVNEADALSAALTNTDSIASLSISGLLENVIDLGKSERLEPFIKLIKDFKLPLHLKKTARELKIKPPILLRTVPQLVKALSEVNWRAYPMQVDLPAVCQVFGQLASSSGIDGICYLSKFTCKKNLAIFPQNFKDRCFIELDGELPSGVKIPRLDVNNLEQMYGGKQ